MAQFQPLTTDISIKTKAITATQRLVTHKPRSHSPQPRSPPLTIPLQKKSKPHNHTPPHHFDPTHHPNNPNRPSRTHTLTNVLHTLPTSHLAPKSSRIESRRSPSHRFERKRRRNTRHNNIQRSTDINRHRRRRIRPSSNARADDSHDPVQADRYAVARAPMSRR